eukprot:6122126-Pyramimonas_sp.AAC.1
MNLPPPSQATISKVPQKASNSSPGPDGLPYAAWLYRPRGPQILTTVMWWCLSGQYMGSDFNYLRKAFIPKGEEDGDPE